VARASEKAVVGWKALLVAVFAVPIGLMLKVLPIKKSIDRTPVEVAGFLRDLIAGGGGEWDWDEFETVPITDKTLERIRHEAAKAGPPNPDIPRLRELLREVEGLR
jgi:hypothetical protein